ncbi:Loki-CTERM sorting domain-containing protein [Variovorax sp. J22R24]|nr:Loki-CTERM sorting domain-containing protein [Variovorax sp. J22R24]MDM0108714.1 Loki-CTERM sorting domain-containing protein [Variovorax sp. J22R24]
MFTKGTAGRSIGYPAAMLLIMGTCGYLYYRFRRADWL